MQKKKSKRRDPVGANVRISAMIRPDQLVKIEKVSARDRCSLSHALRLMLDGGAL